MLPLLCRCPAAQPPTPTIVLGLRAPHIRSIHPAPTHPPASVHNEPPHVCAALCITGDTHNVRCPSLIPQ
ncbi:hypothetical protein B0H17DRAFT_1192462 [Mycena rosella]|uniref:Uncharacterized protein n=1 Tax=Mycena rosella TaxID=1033263 RepID=A0AAD7M9H2_MYCRO|nr:hypothetical protein B0H17DRAFT_1192462 [Mycena rosella]